MKIRETLYAKDCLPIREEKFGDGTSIEMWQKGGRVFLVLHYKDDNGWEIYIPACEKNDTQATLDALDDYLKGGTT